MISISLLRKILTKYGGIPNREAVLVGDEFIRKLKTTLTATEIKALATTQKELVPAVSGKIIVLHEAIIEIEAGSEALTETDDNMIINYVDDSGLAATGAIESTGLIDQTTNRHAIIKGIGVPVGTIAQLVNTPLVLDNTGDNFAGNASDDAVMNVWCHYSLIEL